MFTIRYLLYRSYGPPIERGVTGMRTKSILPLRCCFAFFIGLLPETGGREALFLLLPHGWISSESPTGIGHILPPLGSHRRARQAGPRSRAFSIFIHWGRNRLFSPGGCVCGGGGGFQVFFPFPRGNRNRLSPNVGDSGAASLFPHWARNRLPHQAADSRDSPFATLGPYPPFPPGGGFAVFFAIGIVTAFSAKWRISGILTYFRVGVVTNFSASWGSRDSRLSPSGP